MSRHPDPPNIRLLKNDKGHADRYHKDPVEPSSERPEPPSSLSPRAKEIFEEIVAFIEELCPVSETDTYLLTLYANNQEMLEHLEYLLRTEGVTYEKTSALGDISICSRPEVAMLEKCKAFALKILPEFGLSPSGRVRMGLKKADPTTKKENPFAKLG